MILFIMLDLIPTGVESELTDVCKGVTEGVEEEAVIELDAIMY